MRNRGFHRPSVLFSETADPWAVFLYKYNRVLCVYADKKAAQWPGNRRTLSENDRPLHVRQK